jgi:hypothetical protein
MYTRSLLVILPSQIGGSSKFWNWVLAFYPKRLVIFNFSWKQTTELCCLFSFLLRFCASTNCCGWRPMVVSLHITVQDFKNVNAIVFKENFQLLTHFFTHSVQNTCHYWYEVLFWLIQRIRGFLFLLPNTEHMYSPMSELFCSSLGKFHICNFN